MTETRSRRDFLKTGLAATAAVVVGAKFSRADTQPQLFDKTRIGSLELSNRAIKSSTWSGMADQKGYVTDRVLEFYGELAQGDIGLILTGYQYIMTNGQGLPYMVGNYDDTQVEGLTKLVNAVHKHGGKVVVQLVHSLARANPKMFFKEGDELWGASAIPYSPEDATPKEMTKEDIARFVGATLPLPPVPSSADSTEFRSMALTGMVSTSSYLPSGTAAGTRMAAVPKIAIGSWERFSKQREEPLGRIFRLCSNSAHMISSPAVSSLPSHWKLLADWLMTELPPSRSALAARFL